MSGIPSWARIGQGVVCIDENVNLPAYTNRAYPLDSDPKINGIYTIDWVGYSAAGVPCLGFVECDPEACWDAASFRPLVDDANDSEVEREIYRRNVHQKPAPRKELERVE